MSFCPHCGTGLEPEVKFCPSCGESVELDPVEHKPGKDVAENPENEDDHPAHRAPPGLPETDNTGPAATPETVSPTGSPTGAAPPPKKSLSGCALAAIIGGGAFVFLMAVIGIMMGVAFSATSGASDKLDEWLVKIRAGDTEGAYGMTSSGFREITSLESFRQYLDSYPAIKNSTKAKYSDKTIENGVATFLGTLVDGAGLETKFAAQLIKDGEEWKVQTIQLPEPSVASVAEPPIQEVAMRLISHPEYHLEYSIPADWVEEAKESRFLIKPPKGSPYERRAWMAVRILPNQAANSKEEVSKAMLETLAGLSEMKMDKPTIVLTTEEGAPLKDENEIPAGQYGNLMIVLDYNFMTESTPWKGIAVGAMRHDDKGKFHYITSIRSEESCWEDPDLEAAVVKFLGMKVSYGTN